MRFFLLLSVLISFYASAQYTRQVVQLRNKAFTSGTLANPSTYLTNRAIQRRTRQGIVLDSTDLPVSQRWLDSIRSVPGVQVLSVSRWLNRVLIRTSDVAALVRINAFSFVQSTTPQGLRIAGHPLPQRSKFTETVTDLPSTTGRGQAATGIDTFTYGTNYAQVHIHEGEFLHNKNFTGQGMVIAVMDAGFQNYKTITAFDSVRLQGRILGERDFVAFDNSVNEDHPHGMQCLSTICANWPGRMVGTAPGASFWLIRTEDAPTEYPVEEFNWVVGAEFADSVGCDLISSSLGYTTFDDPQFDHTYAQLNGNTATITIGADYAAHKGLIVTNSAGNDGANSWRYLSVPADGDSVVAVGAVNSAGVIASFSSRGLPNDSRVKPNLVSVGAGTIIAGPTAPTAGNGTSYSNPNLNGLITCLWQAFPEKNNQQLMNVVYQSADRYATPNKDYGYGIPNFKKAYRILKKQRNDITFGVDWLKAAPNPFTDTIRVDFVGQADTTVFIRLLDSTGRVVAVKTFRIEEQEIYSTRFDGLAFLPGGVYTVQYFDGANTRTVPLAKPFGCSGADRYFAMLRPGNGYTYQWQEDATGSGFVNLQENALYMNVNTDTLRLHQPPTAYSGYRYRCIATNGATSVTSAIFELRFYNTWNGNTSTAWENPANWGCGTLPDEHTDVIIKTGTTYPLTVNSNVACRSLTVQNGAAVTITAGYNLNVKDR